MNSDYKLNDFKYKVNLYCLYFYYISMIRYLVLIGGLVFYAFAITNLLKEIRNLALMKVIKTLPSPSSGSLTLTIMVLSPKRK